MLSDSEQRTLASAGDTQVSLPQRMAALRELAAAGNAAAIPGLKDLLERSKPDSAEPGLNYDPAGAERVIDLCIVATLHALGDDSENARIGPLVAAAGDKLEGPEDETKVAAQSITSIGQTGPLQQLIDLCLGSDNTAIKNAVRTLNRLNLPHPATAGAFDNITQLFDTVSFEIHRFREELETVERLGNGHIKLSEGTRQFLKDNDYDRGPVQRDEVTLADFIEQDLDMLGLTYYAQSDAVVVCTYAEACRRWHDWWKRFHERLEFSATLGRFVVGL